MVYIYIYMSWKDVAPYLGISIRTLERRRNELNLTMSSRMGKLFYCEIIFLLLSLGLILCDDFPIFFMHACEVGHRICYYCFCQLCYINCHFNEQSSQLCVYNFLEKKHASEVVLLYGISLGSIRQLFNYFAWR